MKKVLKLSIKNDEFWMDDYIINTTPMEVIKDFLQNANLKLHRGEISFKTYQYTVKTISKNLN